MKKFAIAMMVLGFGLSNAPASTPESLKKAMIIKMITEGIPSYTIDKKSIDINFPESNIFSTNFLSGYLTQSKYTHSLYWEQGDLDRDEVFVKLTKNKNKYTLGCLLETQKFKNINEDLSYYYQYDFNLFLCNLVRESNGLSIDLDHGFIADYKGKTRIE